MHDVLYNLLMNAQGRKHMRGPVLLSPKTQHMLDASPEPKWMKSGVERAPAPLRHLRPAGPATPSRGNASTRSAAATLRAYLHEG
eukprot:6571292-Alexandrium_andersonii.AAC.1